MGLRATEATENGVPHFSPLLREVGIFDRAQSKDPAVCREQVSRSPRQLYRLPTPSRPIPQRRSPSPSRQQRSKQNNGVEAAPSLARPVHIFEVQPQREF